MRARAEDPDVGHAEFVGQCLRRAMQVRPNDLLARHQSALIALHDDQLEDARRTLEAIVKEAPAFTDAHVTLAKVYYRLHRKADGDREREIVLKLNAEKQARGGR